MLTKQTLWVTNVFGLLALIVALASACGGKSSSASCDGKERCACYANQTCNAGLVCLSNLCVAPTGVGGVGVGGSTGFGGLPGVGGVPGTGGVIGVGGSVVASGGATGVGGMSVGTGGAGGTAACVGQQGCACYPNSTCNATLTCSGGVCVPSGAGGTTGAGGAVGGANLIKNGDFSLGKTYWDLTPQAGEVYSELYSGGEYCVYNQSSLMYLSFSLGYPPTPSDAFPIEVGATYTLSYRLKLNGPATVMVKIGQASPPYAELVPTVPFTDSITTGLGAYQTFSHQLQFAVGDPSAGLVFNTALLDYYPISICFDDVRLTKN